MTQATTSRIIKVVTLVGIIPLLLLGHKDGPDPRHTGAPGDLTCAKANCHTGPENPTDGGVVIDFPNGTTYKPGVKQRWTVRVTGAATEVYGFQASARLASNPANGVAGTFSAIDDWVQVLCEENKVKPAGGCQLLAGQQQLEFAEHTAPRPTNSFSFDWTPPATNVGDVKVYIAGNAANGNIQFTGDRIFLNSFTLSPEVPISGPPVLAPNGIFQAFDNKPRLSSGTYIQIFGTNLAASTKDWGTAFQGGQAPTVLDGVRVNVNNKPAFVSYVSPGQVNALTPDDAALGPVNVEVVHSGGTSNPISMTKTKVSPALLNWGAINGRDYAIALFPDFVTYVGRPGMIPGITFKRAKPGDVIIAYAVGCGPTNPLSPAGINVGTINLLASPSQVLFGQTPATSTGFMEFFFTGLCRFNVTVPNVTGDAQGDIRFDASVDGVPTGQTLYTVVQ